MAKRKYYFTVTMAPAGHFVGDFETLEAAMGYLRKNFNMNLTGMAEMFTIIKKEFKQ